MIIFVRTQIHGVFGLPVGMAMPDVFVLEQCSGGWLWVISR